MKEILEMKRTHDRLVKKRLERISKEKGNKSLIQQKKKSLL